MARSCILDPQFWEEGDSCMTDMNVTIADNFIALNVELNIPSFLPGRDQLTQAEVKESQSVTSVRIHVERSVRKIKPFRLLKTKFHLLSMVQ